MVICLYSGRIAPATIDFINIFPFTDVHGSISITPVLPPSIFFLPAIVHAIIMIVKRNKNKKKRICGERRSRNKSIRN